MSTASENLRHNQRQLDMDGTEVGVSRQAVDEVLAELDHIRAGIQKIIDATAHVSRMNTLGMTLREFCSQLINPPDQARGA